MTLPCTLFLLALAFVLSGSTAKETVADTPATGCWTIFQSSNTGLQINEVSALAVLSKDDLWAAGYYSPTYNSYKSLVMHWDGKSWSMVPTPNNEGYSYKLLAIEAISSDDIWATGNYHANDSQLELTLIMHWDGEKWAQVEIPKLGNLGSLNGISAVSKDDIWAVGSYYSSHDAISYNLIMHWDGNNWSPPDEIPNPHPYYPNYPGPNSLHAVAAISQDDVWAIGATDGGPSVLHWNGKNWTEGPFPRLKQGVKLQALAAIGPGDIWVAGVDPDSHLLTLHWDGSVWTPVPAITPGAKIITVVALAAVSKDNIWLIGNDSHSEMTVMLLMHWDGKAWNAVPNVLQDTRQDFSSVVSAGAADPDGSLWMVVPGFSTGAAPLLLRRDTTNCVEATPVATPLVPPVMVPGNDNRTFPETGKAVSGLFLDYWQTHGGLAQQGYPISSLIGEISPLDGKTYTVQYFERAVFEYHPENKSPYNILLSQLGAFRYKSRHPNGAPAQRPNTSPGSRLFPVTGKRLGGRFLDYWTANGGLAQQGYPLSDEFSEVSPSDGKTYTVQYFERAVFEAHPENQPPFDVLLSLSGRFRYIDTYEASSPPVPQLISPYIFEGPATSERYLVWLDYTHRSLPTIRGYDLMEKREFLITDDPIGKNPPATNGKVVAWSEYTVNGHVTVRGYDLTTQSNFTILERSSASYLGNLALDANTLYYRDATLDHRGLFARDLQTGTERLIGKEGEGIRAADGKVVWIAFERYCPGTFCAPTWNLHIQALDGSVKDTVIATAPADNQFTSYGISGDYVVWAERSKGPYLYNISSGTTRAISTDEGAFPVIKGNTVVWADTRYNTTVKVYNIATGQVLKLYPKNSAWITPLAMLGERTLAYGIGDDSYRRDSSKALYIVSLEQAR